MRMYIFSAVVLSLFLFSCKKDPKNTQLSKPVFPVQNDSVDMLKLNQIQVIGSHNSYRTRTYQPIFDMVMNLYNSGVLSEDLNPQGWDYTHETLPKQFGAFGMRAIELDIYEDAQGGRFYNRGGLVLVDEPMASGLSELNEPGYKVLHIPDFDYNTHYLTFKEALSVVKTWSESNPNHLPIFIQVESKTQTVGDQLSFPFLQPSLPFTTGASDALDEEIKSVFGQDLDKVITPDKVRGTYNTLREAVLAGNWPTLGQSRGHVIFVMEGGLVSQYESGHPSLQGRAMFTFTTSTTDHAAFILRNNSIGSFSSIQQEVAAGFIIRTRADGDTEEARTGDYTKMLAAFESGAQIISTDYYKPDPRYKTEPQNWTDFKVAFPDNKTWRINPVSASQWVSLGIITE